MNIIERGVLIGTAISVMGLLSGMGLGKHYIVLIFCGVVVQLLWRMVRGLK